MKKIVYPMLLSVCVAAATRAEPLKVDLNPPDARKDFLSTHWVNWAWHEAASGSQKFGDVSVTFRAAANGSLSPILFKGLLDYGATMACDGILVKTPAKGGIEMVISGLTPGKHTVTTFHNEVRYVESAGLNVSVN